MNQEDLYPQITAAFDPFSKFTEKATKAFIDRVAHQWGIINGYATESIAKLQEKKKTLNDKMNLVKELKASGQISEDVFQNEVSALIEQHDQATVETGAHNVAENKTFRESLRVIELLETAKNFMYLSENWLEKVKLAKLVLSNPTLKDGKLEYSYQIPFDTLIDLTTLRNWWI